MPDIIVGFIAICSMIAVLCIWVCFIKEKRHCIELESRLAMSEKALKELRNIRHQYNNMFQSIVFFMENEHFGSKKDFINEIMEKTSELNKNNILQLINIKSCELRSLVFKMAEVCDKNGVHITIMVSGEASQSNNIKPAICKAIGNVFDYTLNETMNCSKKEITIEVSSDDQGVSVIIDSFLDTGIKLSWVDYKASTCNNSNNKSEQAKAVKILERRKDVIFNSYMDNDHFKLEIMILQNH